MKILLVCLFSLIIVVMAAVTVAASLDRSILRAGNLMEDPWFLATLCDAYCGFLTFYVWVAYKETRWLSRVLWFVLIMLLGNFAMAGYMLIQLAKVPSDVPLSNLLLRDFGQTAR